MPLFCQILVVSPSGYYTWLKRPDSPRQKEEARLVIEIKAAHKINWETFGSKRLQTDFAEHGVQNGAHRIKRIRKERDICCTQTQKLKTTTNSNHSLPGAESLLEQLFRAVSTKRPAAGLIHHSDRGSQN